MEGLGRDWSGANTRNQRCPGRQGREACCYKPVKEKKDEGPRCGQLGGNGAPADTVLGERRPKEEVPVTTLNVYRVRHSVTGTHSIDPVKGHPAHAWAGSRPFLLLKVKPAFLSY